jgi:hypothetical protein
MKCCGKSAKVQESRRKGAKTKPYAVTGAAMRELDSILEAAGMADNWYLARKYKCGVCGKTWVTFEVEATTLLEL